MKKGFTLIELLAVIVILAIIALIATPLIMNVIDDSKKGAFKSSAYGIIEAAELEYANSVVRNEKEEMMYTYENGRQTGPENNKLNYKGGNPESGNVYVSKDGKIAMMIYNGKYCAEKTYDESEIRITEKSKEECQIPQTFECGKMLFDERDGNLYRTVKIGSQCWFAENLRYTSNGCLDKPWVNDDNQACIKTSKEELETYKQYSEWLQEIVWYQYNVAFNWDGINPASSQEFEEKRQGICPTGWHIPNINDIDVLGNSTVNSISGKLKASAPIWNGTDNFGFKMLPTGYRNNAESISGLGESSILLLNYTNDNYGGHLNMHFVTNYNSLQLISTYQNMGISVRCIKD